MSDYREWDEHYADVQRRLELRKEHNATVRAYRDAMAECERLGKANGEACDRIAELESERDDLRESRDHYQAERDNLESRASIMAKERDECWRILNAANLNLCPTADLGFAVKQLLELESRPVLTWEECDAKLQTYLDRDGGLCLANVQEYLDWLKSRLPAPTDSIRVPFSDAQIERMAKACRNKFECDERWDQSAYQEEWKESIRAALAAGGLEPCAAPVDSEHELWKRIEPGLGEHIEPLVDAYLRGHMEVTGQKESSISYSRVGLSYVRDAVIGSLIVAVPERASDEELVKAAWSAMYGLYPRMKPYNYASALEQGIAAAVAAAVRSRVEAPLLAEIQRLDIENRDRAFYVREFAAVSQERDTLKARVAELEADNTRQRENVRLAEAEVAASAIELAALRQPAPIASPDVLEQLAEIWDDAFDAAFKEGVDARIPAIAAILRAAQAYVDDTALNLTMKTRHLNCEEYMDYLNSRIRYRVALPETPKGLPTPDELARAMFKATGGNERNYDDGVERLHLLAADCALAALRPWLHEPTGWKLDVTWQEVQAAYYRHQSGSPEGQCWHQVIELLRARIRPTFECAECAKNKSERDVMYRDWDDCRNRMLAVRLALNEGSES